jgi:hypothetical protein
MGGGRICPANLETRKRGTHQEEERRGIAGDLHDDVQSLPSGTRKVRISRPARTPVALEQEQRAVIAEVAVLDPVGSLVTVAAAVILIVNDDANPWWWLGVGLAATLIVISAASLIPMRRRYRAEGHLVAAAAGGQPANGATPGTNERVARITARPAVLVALITLAGTWATASATGRSPRPARHPRPSQAQHRPEPRARRSTVTIEPSCGWTQRWPGHS